MKIYDIIKEFGITEGWSPIFGGCIVSLDEVYGKIIISDIHDRMVLNKDGAYNTNGECLIFPSKGNRDWNKVLLNEAKDKLLPPFTPVMVSDDGEKWSVKYYIDGQFCSISKNSIYGSCYRYIVPVSKFDFDVDDLFTNIKNSVQI